MLGSLFGKINVEADNLPALVSESEWRELIHADNKRAAVLHTVDISRILFASATRQQNHQHEQ